MTEFEKDIEQEKRTMAIINFYKLIYIEKLAFDKSLDTFVMLGGESAMNRLKMDVSDNLISLNKSNYSVISSLNSRIDKCVNGHITLGPNFREEVAHLGWLSEMIEDIDEEETLYNTLVINSNSFVYEDMIEKTFDNEITDYHKKYLMKKKIRNIFNKSSDIK